MELWSASHMISNIKIDGIFFSLPGECTCTKPISPFIVYAGPGQQSATVSWPMPEAEKEDGAACERGSVVPPDAVSGGRYSLGKHVINYSFSNGAENPTIANCLVEFTVVRKYDIINLNACFRESALQIIEDL